MATDQPPQASLTGIPPELRNTVYNLVADNIKEVSIIGRKLKEPSSSITADNAKTHFWNAVAKRPLSQTCILLRLEFDSIHQHRVISTGVRHYWLHLENFDLDRMGDLANLIRHLPGLLTHLRNKSTLRVSLCIGKGAMDSLDTLLIRSHTPNRINRGHRELRNILHYQQLSIGQVNVRVRTNIMSRAQRRAGITHDEFKDVRLEVDNVFERLWRRIKTADPPSCQDHDMLSVLPWPLEERQREFYREQRRAHEQKALHVHDKELGDNLRLKLKSELKRELRQALAEQPKTSKLDAVIKFLDED